LLFAGASILIGLTAATSAGLVAPADDPRAFITLCGEMARREAAPIGAPDPTVAFAEFRGNGAMPVALERPPVGPSTSFPPMKSISGNLFGSGGDDYGDGRYQQPPPGTDWRLGAGGRVDATQAELLRVHPMDFPIVPLPSTGLLAAAGLIAAVGYRRRA
jgi:hypothetical protein